MADVDTPESTPEPLEEVGLNALLEMIDEANDEGRALALDVQHHLAHHELVVVRRHLAAGVLDMSVKTVLVEDEDRYVLSNLLSAHADGADVLALRAIERYQGQRYETTVMAVISLAMDTTSAAVQRALFEVLEIDLLLTMVMVNTDIDDAAWPVLLARPECADSPRLLLALAKREFRTMPAPVAEHLRTHGNGDVSAVLCANPGFTLSQDLPVAALRGSARGQEFLDRSASPVQDAWDALVPDWSGSVEELLAACDHFAR